MSDPTPLSPFETWLREILAESLLWPVLAVGALTIASFGSAVLVAAVYERSLAAMGVVAVVAGLSVWALDADLRRRRVGPVGALIFALWALSALGALALTQLTP